MANISTVGPDPYDIFVDTNNTLYAASRSFNQVLVWSEGSNTPTRNISGGLANPVSVFVASNGDMYVDNGKINHRVDKWTWNGTSSVSVMNVTSKCISLFIDINDTLYCSNDEEHKVVKVSLHNGSTQASIAAGNGTPGSGPYMLNLPNGVFIDMKLNLYVADCGNDRIQMFSSGQRSGTTIAGSGAPGTITLSCPVEVALDADGYLFISDPFNYRIVGSGPAGYRCLVGCPVGSGTASSQSNRLRALNFDSFGNMFVVDRPNSLIQKFLLATNSCGMYDCIKLQVLYT